MLDLVKGETERIDSCFLEPAEGIAMSKAVRKRLAPKPEKMLAESRHLQRFLLELGSGFAFVARQKHVRIEEKEKWS